MSVEDEIINLDNVTEIVDKSVENFMEWWGIKGNVLGQGDYDKQMKDVNDIVNKFNLPRKKFILHRQGYRFGFTFYYGDIVGSTNDKYLPIPFATGTVLTWISKNNVNSDDSSEENKSSESNDYVWPLKDFEGNYFIPECTVKIYGPPSGSMPTSQHIDEMLRASIYNSNYMKILISLTPYAEQLAESYPMTYLRVVDNVPGYPEDYIELAKKKIEDSQCCIQ